MINTHFSIFFTDLLESDEKVENPNLTELRSVLKKYLVSKDPLSRGIVFAKQREMVRALVAWINQDENRSGIKAAMFTGANAATDSGGKIKQP